MRPIAASCSFVLALLCLAGCKKADQPVAAAAPPKEDEPAAYQYTENPAGVTIEFHKDSKAKTAVVPAMIGGKPVTQIGIGFYAHRDLLSVSLPGSVTHIGSDAFKECRALTAIVLPAGLKELGSAAFYDCEKLVEVNLPPASRALKKEVFYLCKSLPRITIPGSVTSIGNEAFYGCESLAALELPEGVTHIGEEAFSYCLKLASVSLPGTLTSIGRRAFWDCESLTSVTIPKSVTSIGLHAFGGKTGLTNIMVAADHPAYATEQGVLFDKARTTLIQCPGQKTGSYSPPEGVVAIAPDAFTFCQKITHVIFPSSLREIGEYAFTGCFKLSAVVIPAGVTEIGTGAFDACSSLSSLAVAADNPNYCSVDDILFTKDMTTLIHCPAKRAGSYVVPNGVVRIAGKAFRGCDGLTQVSIPATVTSIGEDAFTSGTQVIKP